MKRWIFLMALPYVVWTTSITYDGMVIDPGGQVCDSDKESCIDCGSREMCDDLREALNEAHKRRVAAKHIKRRPESCLDAANGSHGCSN